VIAALATLKAGGAYVPVDPEYPAERVAFVLADSAAPVVITDTARAAGLPAHCATVVRVDGAEAVTIAGRPETRPETAVTPDDPCYVIYTSGSTGTPKGVVLRHRGVLNNLCDLDARFAVGPRDSVLALSSPSFDMSVYELLGVPGAGGSVVIPEPELLRDPAHWSELLVEHGITVWNSAPSLLDMLLDHLEQSTDPHPATLRLVLLGGDWIPVGMPARIRAVAPVAQVVSLGGATEASIHSVVYPIGEVDPEWTAIPYGRPMANQEAYILDEQMQPVPVGVPGELHLGGVGLASGYLNRPELTTQKFPVWRGRTVYRTGDLARWRRDGVIELLGRKDFMVKVNGLRIELGEIESVLRQARRRRRRRGCRPCRRRGRPAAGRLPGGHAGAGSRTGAPVRRRAAAAGHGARCVGHARRVAVEPQRQGRSQRAGGIQRAARGHGERAAGRAGGGAHRAGVARDPRRARTQPDR
jgi:amino acid adenylation domain-containing protein